MNKEKIVGLSDRLNEIVDEANRHPNGTPGCITWDKAVYAIEALSKELNSKIKMPKVFDDWYKQTNKDLVAEQIVELSSIATGLEPYHGFNDAQLALQDWLSSDEDFLKCIDAIINGYEVNLCKDCRWHI